MILVLKYLHRHSSNFVYKADIHERWRRKTPMLQTKSLLVFVKYQFDKSLGFWSSILWFDKTKIELLGLRDVAFVWQKMGKAFNLNNPVPLLKWWWGVCFLFSWTESLVKVDAIMNKENYILILDQILIKRIKSYLFMILFILFLFWF